LQLINPSTSPNELNTTLTPHNIIHADACFAYFNKIWGIPNALVFRALKS
jgi:HD superfamily phosphohydrolase YqeK